MARIINVLQFAIFTLLGHIYLTWPYLPYLAIFTLLGHIYLTWPYLPYLAIFTLLGHIYLTCYLPYLLFAISRKYINAFLSYSAKTKRDGQTDRQTEGRGALQIHVQFA